MATSEKLRFSYIFGSPAEFDSIHEFGKALKRLAELGFDGAEFEIRHPLGFEIDQLQQLASDAQIEICSLLSGWSYFHEGLSLSSQSRNIRKLAVARLAGYVETAARFQAILVVGQMQGFLKDEPDEVIANERIAQELKEVCLTAEKHGVAVVMEPVNHLQVGFNHTVDDVVAMIRRVDSPALKPMVDTIHMNIEEQSITEPIYRLGKNLGHVHLCETNGRMFGTGNLDFQSVLQALTAVEYDGFISVKVYRGVKWEEGAKGSMEYLRSLGVA